ncbi:carbohydrate ABC transporter permease [Demequina sp. SYSU T00068]|uniref:carbohydrate ABC transporter permease n=1 Tax=Demequina lignilytica TaxID=3051663 RepID=UPI00263773FA|nr:carbohydrate ABC transporter permease [Demequina sp. SYSU T00068]MDN4491648.1 carbohydrate ABC transporter permease [Demequina sp. SYSU T00068]
MTTSSAPVRMKARRERTFTTPAGTPDYIKIGLWLSLVVTAALWAVPFYIMFVTSLKSKAEIANSAAWELPQEWLWSNYADAVETGNLWTTGGNSLLISVIKVPLGLLLAAAVAFAIARIRFRGSRALLAFIAVGSMVPIQIGLGPLFNTMLSLDLLNNRWGLLLPYLAFGIPYQVFVLYGFMRSIPDEIEESARVDGASTLRIFFRLILPLAKPALAALFILDFVATWNEYAIATTLLQSQANWTVPLAVQSFSTQFSTDFGPLNAFVFMSAVPVLIVYLLFQRYFVSGALAGAVKG